jgi:hypothetical protein
LWKAHGNRKEFLHNRNNSQMLASTWFTNHFDSPDCFDAGIFCSNPWQLADPFCVFMGVQRSDQMVVLQPPASGSVGSARGVFSAIFSGFFSHPGQTDCGRTNRLPRFFVAVQDTSVRPPRKRGAR